MTEPVGPIRVRLIGGSDLIGWEELYLAVMVGAALHGAVLGLWIATVLGWV